MEPMSNGLLSRSEAVAMYPEPKIYTALIAVLNSGTRLSSPTRLSITVSLALSGTGRNLSIKLPAVGTASSCALGSPSKLCTTWWAYNCRQFLKM